MLASLLYATSLRKGQARVAGLVYRMVRALSPRYSSNADAGLGDPPPSYHEARPPRIDEGIPSPSRKQTESSSSHGTMRHMPGQSMGPVGAANPHAYRTAWPTNTIALHAVGLEARHVHADEAKRRVAPRRGRPAARRHRHPHLVRRCPLGSATLQTLRSVHSFPPQLRLDGERGPRPDRHLGDASHTWGRKRATRREKGHDP